MCDKYQIHPTLFYQWQKPFSRRELPLLEKLFSHWKKEQWLNLELVAHITHRHALN